MSRSQKILVRALFLLGAIALLAEGYLLAGLIPQIIGGAS